MDDVAPLTYELLFEGPVDDSADNLRRLKACFLADLELEIADIQRALNEAPTVILTSTDLDGLREKCTKLLASGGLATIRVQDLEGVSSLTLNRTSDSADRDHDLPPTTTGAVPEDNDSPEDDFSFELSLSELCAEPKTRGEQKRATDRPPAKSWEIELPPDVAELIEPSQEEESLEWDGINNPISDEELLPDDLTSLIPETVTPPPTTTPYGGLPEYSDDISLSPSPNSTSNDRYPEGLAKTSEEPPTAALSGQHRVVVWELEEDPEPIPRVAPPDTNSATHNYPIFDIPDSATEAPVTRALKKDLSRAPAAKGSTEEQDWCATETILAATRRDRGMRKRGVLAAAATLVAVIIYLINQSQNTQPSLSGLGDVAWDGGAVGHENTDASTLFEDNKGPIYSGRSVQPTHTLTVQCRAASGTLRTCEVLVTSPEPPELTPEEIVKRRVRAPWLRRVEIRHTLRREAGDGPGAVWRGLGQARTYIEFRGQRGRIAASYELTVEESKEGPLIARLVLYTKERPSGDTPTWSFWGPHTDGRFYLQLVDSVSLNL